MHKKFFLDKLNAKIFQRSILCFPILGILYFEVFKKLYFPITDDWLYIPWGSHQLSPGNINDFALVAGHQQIITKYSIWLLGFAPKFYLPYVGFLNFVFAVTGYLLLVNVSFKYINKKVNFLFVFSFFILAFSYKPFYMYMTATALGPMQAIFLIGIYYHIKNTPKNRTSDWMLILVIFLSPFTTGLGMIVPLTEILENIYLFIRNRIISRYSVIKLFVCVIGLSLAYVWPLITENIDIRAQYGERGLVENIFGVLSNPIGTFRFILTLFGSVFTPSNRYDPNLSMILGFLFLIFTLYFLFQKVSRSDFQDILLNKNTILGGFCFIVLLIFTRFGGIDSEIIGATAPRYITGYMVFILGIMSLLVKKNDSKKMFTVLLMFFVMLALISGLKTGLEWQKVRWSQTTNIVKCIQGDLKYERKISDSCLNLAFQLRRENTDYNTFNYDFYNYLNVSKLITKSSTK